MSSQSVTSENTEITYCHQYLSPQQDWYVSLLLTSGRFATLETRRGLEPKLCPAIVCGIVTRDALVRTSNSPRSLCESQLGPVFLVTVEKA